MQKLLISALCLIYIFFTQTSALNAKNKHLASDSEVKVFLDLDLTDGTQWYGLYYRNSFDIKKKYGYRYVSTTLPSKNSYARNIIIEDTFYFSYFKAGKHLTYQSTIINVFNSNPPYNLITAKSRNGYGGEPLKIETFVRRGKSTRVKKKVNQWISNKDPKYTLNDYYAFNSWLSKETREKSDTVLISKWGQSKGALKKMMINEVKPSSNTNQKYSYIEVLETNFFQLPSGELLTKSTWEKEQLVGFTFEQRNGLLIHGFFEPEMTAKAGMSKDNFTALNETYIDYRSHNALAELRKDTENIKNISQVTFEIIGRGETDIVPEYTNHFTRSDLKTSKKYLILGVPSKNYELEKVQKGYYVETKQFVKNNPILVQKSKEITKYTKTDDAKIKAIKKWVRNHIKTKSVYGTLTPYELLDAPFGDCTELATLFGALVKASGIPARKVNGYHGGYLTYGAKSFSLHRWNEVAQDGVWVPVDVAFDKDQAVFLELIRHTGKFPTGKDQYKLKLISVEYKKYKKVFE